MSLVVKAWSQPMRPISKGGDVEKGGDVDYQPQKVGTSFGTSKRWGRRPKVGTSFSLQKGGDVATDCGDVPTFLDLRKGGHVAQMWGRRLTSPPFFQTRKGGDVVKRWGRRERWGRRFDFS